MARLPLVVSALALAIGLAASCQVLAGRSALEASRLSVEIVVDYAEACSLAGATGRSVSEVLGALREAGATGIGVPEESLATLIETGRATVACGGEAGGVANAVRIAIPQADLRAHAASNLEAKWSLVGSEGETLAVPGSLRDLERVGVGWDPARVAEARGSGLTPIARPLDSPVVSAGGLSRTFDELSAAGFGGVLFQGKFVLGNSALLPQTAEELRSRGITDYAIELEVQAGTEELARLLQGAVIRTHSISEAELGKMAPDAAVERFARGVRERGIRCCFVRLFLDRACPDPLALNVDYVGAIRQEVLAAGRTPGAATPLPPYNLSHRLDPVIGLGAAGGIGLLLVLFLGGGGIWLACFAAAIALCAGLPLLHPLGRHAVALAAVVALPVLGALAPRLDRDGGSPAVRALLALALGAACAAAGGVLAAGVLSDSLLMVKVGQFRGVKLALALPVLLVASAYAMDLLPDGRPLSERLGGGVTALRRMLATPLSVGALLAIVAVVGVAGYGLVRSGNAGASTMSGAERAAREALEGLLVYRPRTKEFLIGHPALVLAGWMAARGRRRLACLAAIIGAVGLSSLANTFCHIHTPVLATVLRSLFGVVLGGLIGIVVAGAFERGLSVRERVRSRDG